MKLDFQKIGIGPLLIKYFICPEKGDQFAFSGIGNIVGVSRWNIHYLGTISRNGVLDYFGFINFPETDNRLTPYDQKFLCLGVMKMVTAGNSGLGGGNKHLPEIG